jgi:hypothetical protein
MAISGEQGFESDRSNRHGQGTYTETTKPSIPLRLTFARSRRAKLASTFDLGSTFLKAARSQEFFLGDVIERRDCRGAIGGDRPSMTPA